MGLQMRSVSSGIDCIVVGLAAAAAPAAAPVCATPGRSFSPRMCWLRLRPHTLLGGKQCWW